MEEICFLHDTEVNKEKVNSSELQFMDAVHAGNVKIAKQLIEEGMNVNFILDHYSPLHAAIEQESMDMLELLLSQPNIDLNIISERKEAPLLSLLLSYRINSSRKELFALRLIRAGCNINISDEYGTTPLHISLEHPSIWTITHELLKQGTDVNAQSSIYGTALHYAVKLGYLELVCMLLYYNADVYVKWEGHTPFSLAVYRYTNDHKIVEVLSDYYSFLDEDINYIIDNVEVCCAFLKYTNAELFKRIWLQFDPKIILSRCPEFIDNYLNWCEYSPSDWVECLYLILNSDIAFGLIEHTDNFFDIFLESMWKGGVQSEDRIGLLYMVLGLGFEIKIKDINTVVAIYGLNQDLEPLIYGTYSSITDGSKFICPLHAFVIGMQTDYSIKKISKLIQDASEEWLDQYFFYGMWNEDTLVETFIKPVAFFSHPADIMNDIINLFVNVHHELDGFHLYDFYVTMIRERLQGIPEFPSLAELSRNQIHKYLVQKFRFKQPYQLQDCVKKLPIPNKIKDIILFKEPIY